MSEEGKAVMRRLPLIVLAGCFLAASAAFAQERPGAASPGGAPKSGATKPRSTKPGATAPGGVPSRRPPSRSWAKLCETPTATSRDLLGKPQAVGVTTCLVLSEQIDATSGAVRVAAAVQQAEGRQTLVVKVAPDADRAPGVRLMILPRDLWQKVLANDRAPLQSSRVRRLTLAYSSCSAEGCLAETKATAALLAHLKSSGGLLVAILKGRRAIAYPVSLSGFREAYEGPSVDSARFRATRAELLRQIRERQKGLQPPLGPPGDGQDVVPPRPPGDGLPPRRPGDGSQDI
jgi:invasion protein IalB